MLVNYFINIFEAGMQTLLCSTVMPNVEKKILNFGTFNLHFSNILYDSLAKYFLLFFAGKL